MIELPLYFQKKLHDDEEVILFVRPFGLVYTGWVLMSLVLIFGPLYYFFHFLKFGYWGVAILLIIFLLGIFSLLKTIVVWRYTAVVITNKRIIDFDQHSLFVRQLSEAPLVNVQDISLSQKGIWALLLNFGTIKIQTAGANAVLELSYIRYPRQVHEVLVDLKEKTLAQISAQKLPNDWQKDPKLQSFFSVLEQKKQELGEKNLQEALDEWLEKDK
jgi:uncharacterized membrane protein YdbT with pleckstrin-like domain